MQVIFHFVFWTQALVITKQLASKWGFLLEILCLRRTSLPTTDGKQFRTSFQIYFGLYRTCESKITIDVKSSIEIDKL